MANAKRDTGKILIECGAKRVLSPSKLCKRHRTYAEDNNMEGVKPWREGCVLMVGVMDLDFGDYMKELTDDYSLRAMKESPMGSSTYYELSKKAVDALNKHPRLHEIVG